MIIMPVLITPRKSLQGEMDEIVDELTALQKIFRELWDIRIAQESMARTMESQNV